MDLRKLLEEGEKIGGNEKSRKICQKLEVWIKKGLGEASKRYKKMHPDDR